MTESTNLDQAPDGDAVESAPAGPARGATEDDPLREIVAEFLAGYSSSGRAAYADHLGYPYRVVENSAGTIGAARDVSELRNGYAYFYWCTRNDLDPLVDVTSREIHRWVTELTASRNAAGEPLDEATAGLMVSAASAFYDWACTAGYARWQPVVLDRTALGVSTRPRRAPATPLPLREVALLQRFADHDPARYGDPARSGATVALLFILGLTVPELTALTRADQRLHDGRPVLEVAGRTGSRTVVLPAAVTTRLQRYLAGRDARPPANTRPDDRAAEPLIASTGRTGELTALRNDDCVRKLKTLAAAAGLDNPAALTPTAGRTTWQQLARDAGVPADAIAAHLGDHTTAGVPADAPAEIVATALAGALAELGTTPS
jgi:integrase